MQTLVIKNSIVINAPVQNVWDALVNPEKTKVYMFGCEAISDWKKGSTLIWRMDYEGKEFIPVKGNIVEFIPEKLLAYTTFNPHGGIPDVPSNYLTVTYALQDDKGSTLFTVTQGDYNTVEDGRRRYEEAYNDGKGWNPILEEIKKLVESKP